MHSNGLKVVADYCVTKTEEDVTNEDQDNAAIAKAEKKEKNYTALSYEIESEEHTKKYQECCISGKTAASVTDEGIGQRNKSETEAVKRLETTILDECRSLSTDQVEKKAKGIEERQPLCNTSESYLKDTDIKVACGLTALSLKDTDIQVACGFTILSSVILPVVKDNDHVTSFSCQIVTPGDGKEKCHKKYMKVNQEAAPDSNEETCNTKSSRNLNIEAIQSSFTLNQEVQTLLSIENVDRVQLEINETCAAKDSRNYEKAEKQPHLIIAHKTNQIENSQEIQTGDLVPSKVTNGDTRETSDFFPAVVLAPVESQTENNRDAVISNPVERKQEGANGNNDSLPTLHLSVPGESQDSPNNDYVSIVIADDNPDENGNSLPKQLFPTYGDSPTETESNQNSMGNNLMPFKMKDDGPTDSLPTLFVPSVQEENWTENNQGILTSDSVPFRKKGDRLTEDNKSVSVMVLAHGEGKMEKCRSVLACDSLKKRNAALPRSHVQQICTAENQLTNCSLLSILEGDKKTDGKNDFCLKSALGIPDSQTSISASISSLKGINSENVENSNFTVTRNQHKGTSHVLEHLVSTFREEKVVNVECIEYGLNLDFLTGDFQNVQDTCTGNFQNEQDTCTGNLNQVSVVGNKDTHFKGKQKQVKGKKFDNRSQESLHYQLNTDANMGIKIPAEGDIVATTKKRLEKFKGLKALHQKKHCVKASEVKQERPKESTHARSFSLSNTKQMLMSTRVKVVKRGVKMIKCSFCRRLFQFKHLRVKHIEQVHKEKWNKTEKLAEAKIRDAIIIKDLEEQQQLLTRQLLDNIKQLHDRFNASGSVGLTQVLDEIEQQRVYEENSDMFEPELQAAADFRVCKELGEIENLGGIDSPVGVGESHGFMDESYGVKWRENKMWVPSGNMIEMKGSLVFSCKANYTTCSAKCESLDLLNITTAAADSSSEVGWSAYSPPFQKVPVKYYEGVPVVSTSHKSDEMCIWKKHEILGAEIHELANVISNTEIINLANESPISDTLDISRDCASETSAIADLLVISECSKGKVMAEQNTFMKNSSRQALVEVYREDGSITENKPVTVQELGFGNEPQKAACDVKNDKLVICRGSMENSGITTPSSVEEKIPSQSTLSVKQVESLDVELGVTKGEYLGVDLGINTHLSVTSTTDFITKKQSDTGKVKINKPLTLQEIELNDVRYDMLFPEHSDSAVSSTVLHVSDEYTVLNCHNNLEKNTCDNIRNDLSEMEIKKKTFDTLQLHSMNEEQNKFVTKEHPHARFSPRKEIAKSKISKRNTGQQLCNTGNLKHFSHLQNKKIADCNMLHECVGKTKLSNHQESKRKRGMNKRKSGKRKACTKQRTKISLKTSANQKLLAKLKCVAAFTKKSKNQNEDDQPFVKKQTLKKKSARHKIHYPYVKKQFQNTLNSLRKNLGQHSSEGLGQQQTPLSLGLENKKLKHPQSRLARILKKTLAPSSIEQLGCKLSVNKKRSSSGQRSNAGRYSQILATLTFDDGEKKIISQHSRSSCTFQTAKAKHLVPFFSGTVSARSVCDKINTKQTVLWCPDKRHWACGFCHTYFSFAVEVQDHINLCHCMILWGQSDCTRCTLCSVMFTNLYSVYFHHCVRNNIIEDSQTQNPNFFSESKTSLKIDAEKTADSTKQKNKSLDLVPVKVFTIPVLNQRVHTLGTSTSAPAAVAGNRRKLSTSDDHQPEIKIPRMDQPPPFQPHSAPQSFSRFNPPINVPPPSATAAATATVARIITQKTSAIMPGTFPGFSVRPPGQPVLSSQTSSVWTGTGQLESMHQMDRSKMITGMQQIGVPSLDWQMQQKMHNRCDVRGAENISPEWKEERPKFSLSKDISESRDLDMKEREAEQGRGTIHRQSFSPLSQHRNNSHSPVRFGQVFRGRQNSPRRRPRSISPVGSVIAHRRSRSPMRQQHAKSRSPSRAGGQKSFSPRSHRRLSISPKNTKSLGRINASNSSRLSRSPGKRHSSPQRDLTRRSSQNLGYQESKNFTKNESHRSSSPLRQNLNSGRDKIIDKEQCKMTKKDRKEQSFRAQPSSSAQQKSFGTGREEMSLKHQNVATGWFEGNPVKASGRQEDRNLSPRNQRSYSQEHSRYNSASQGISIQSHHIQDRETSPDLKIRVGPSGNRETYTRRSPSPRRVVELYIPQQPLTSGRSAGESRSTFSPQRYPDKERLCTEQFRGKEQSWSGHRDGSHKAAAGPGSRALDYPSKTEETASTGSHYPSNIATTAASLDIPGLDLLIKAMTKDSGSAERGGMKLWPGSIDTSKGQAGEKDKQERSGWWREDSKSSPVFDKPGNRESFSRENQGLKTTRDLMTLRQEAAKHLANVEKTNLGSTQVLQTSRPSDVGLTMSSQQSMRPMTMASDDVSTRDTFLANVQIDSRSSLDNSSANPTGHFSWGSSNSSNLQQPSLERTSLDRRLAGIQGFDRPSMQEPSWMGPNRVGIERKGFDQAIWPEGAPGSSNWMPKNIVQDYGHGRSNQPRDDHGMGGANSGRPGLVQAMGLGGGDALDLPRPGWGRGEARQGSLDREQAGSWPGMQGNMATRGGLGDMGRGMGARENMGGTAGLGGRGGFGMTGDRGGRGEMGLGGVSRDLRRPGNSGEPFSGSWLPPPSQPGPNQFMPYR